jgi:hypothetical protein
MKIEDKIILVPNVYIIESAKMDEYIRKEWEGPVIQSGLNIMKISNQYFPIFTRGGLQYVLNEVEAPYLTTTNGYNELHLPVVHISAHGDENCFALTDNTRIHWNELQEILSPVNKRCDGCLILCMSICHGFMAYNSANTWKESDLPYSLIIGPNQAIDWRKSFLAFLSFYSNFNVIQQNGLDYIIDIMNTAIQEKIFNIANGEDIQARYKDEVIKTVATLLKKKREKDSSNSSNLLTP